MHLSKNKIVKMEHMGCAYDTTPVFHGINFTLAEGQFAAIVGPSGSGKTTFLKSMLGLVKIFDGTVRVLGKRLDQGLRAQGVGYMPQLELIDWNFPMTVTQTVLLGRAKQMGIWPWPQEKDIADVNKLLTRLGIYEFRDQHISKLSGGQQQRVFLARALVSNPKLLILDEPINGVDVKTRDNILNLLLELNREGLTIILTAHDLNIVRTYIPWVICFNKGIVAEGEPKNIYTAETLSKTYNTPLHIIKYRDGEREFDLVAEAPMQKIS